MSRISTRIGSIAPSATLAVDAKAKALQAQGIDVVGFGAGEPDFPTPAHIVEAAIAACSVARYHRYSPTPGLPELREAIAAKTVRDSGYDVSPSQVLVTNGGKQAVYEAFATLLDPGDEVLVPTPYWTTYPEAIRLAGGVPVEVETTSDQGYLVSVEQLAAARTPRTKVLLVVSPDNPTGAVHTPEELTAIGQWALETGLWVVTDEIYEHLTYGVESASIPVLVPELADRTIVLNGVAKTYAMTGWRVGWLIGPQDVVTAATNLQSHSTSNVSNVAQAAALAAVTGPLDAVEEMKVAFNRRRKLMLSLLSEAGQLVVPEPQGAFYCFPDASMYLGGRFPSTTDLATGLLEEAQVAVVPGEAFGAPGCLRLSYALGDEAITKGVTRMTAWLTRL